MHCRDDISCFLFGRARAGVLRTLLGQPDARLSARELAHATSLSEGAIRHEVRMPKGMGLLLLHAEQRNRARYQANAEHAALSHLQQLFTAGAETGSKRAAETGQRPAARG